MHQGNLRRALALAFKRTPRGSARQVLLYETNGCGLCRETFRALRRLALEMALEIVRVDVAREPALFDRLGLRVPVVAVSGAELDAAGLGESELREFLRRR